MIDGRMASIDFNLQTQLSSNIGHQRSSTIQRQDCPQRLNMLSIGGDRKTVLEDAINGVQDISPTCGS